MNIQGFKGKKNWYKGNLHSHTTVSDGMLTPSEATKIYSENGYNFLCLSEHDTYTDFSREFNTDNFIIIPGIEYSAVLYEAEGIKRRIKIHHLHGILGTKEMQSNAKKPLLNHMERIEPMLFYKEWKGAEVAQNMADMLSEYGLITTYNHPIWSRVEKEEFAETKGISMLEIYNFNTVKESNTGYDITYWDYMLRSGKKINAFASDDNHNEGMFTDHCGGWICVNGDELTHEEIVSEIIAGNYYSSSAPIIYDWGIKDGIAYINCSDVNSITFVAGNVINDGWTYHGTDFTDDLSTATYKLKGHEKYIRVECTDKYGRTAWTNPIYLG